MGDAVSGVVLEALLGKVVSLAAEEISLSWNVKKQLTKLAEEMEKIQALLCYAQSNYTSNPVVRPWLKELQSLVLDAQIVLDEFGYEVLRQKIASHRRNKVRKCLSLSLRHHVVFRPKIAHKIKDVLSSFEKLYIQSIPLGLQAMQLIPPVSDPKEMRLTVPFVEDSMIVGREDDISKVKHMLTHSEEKVLPVITILGMGGQGKTTLAQLIYKDEDINRHFQKVIWVCVSDDFSVERLLSEMLQSLTKENHQLTNAEALVNRLGDKMRGQRYLLVLDDVWNDNGVIWNRMRVCLLAIGGSKDCKILTTTRSEDVAEAMGTSKCHRLQKLSEDESWSLFEKCAFAEGGVATKTEQLVKIGKRILGKCRGVPLAIKAVAGLLYFKNSEQEWSVIETSKCWSMDSEKDMVLSTIKLSYDHLPSLSIKQCFGFCSLFEKDTLLEKDKLIRLWMAEGLLNPPRGSQLRKEEIGENYYNILLRNSLLQDTKMNNLKKGCKMHDFVHDVSLKVSEDYCYHIKDWKAETNKIEAVHVSISSIEKGMWERLKAVLPSKLRTLRVNCLDDLCDDLFQNLKYLSVLIVAKSDAKELPNSIGEVKHLRFLDIGGCRGLKRLPESFTKLYYLETIVVRELEMVPNGFENLSNLRHIEVEEYWHHKVLYKRLGRLRNLQTLPGFRVDKKEGCQIEELQHLDNLRGELRIWDLQNVGSYESATKANLSNKLNIQGLELEWDSTKMDEDRDDSDVVEGLKPHSNLKSLAIWGCQISKFPSWMVGENNSLLLQNLVSLWLIDLSKCESLPSLGHLPFLERLIIEGLPKVKCIDKEFHGWSKSHNCNNNEPQIITLFPALRRFDLENMDSLVEWSDGIEMISIPPHSSFVQFKVFPYLEELKLSKLPKLSVFPKIECLPRLKQLFVWECDNVKVRNVESGEIIGTDGERHSGYFPSLSRLSLEDSDKLVAPICSLFKSLMQLEYLCIHCHPDLWPKDLHNLRNLRSLDLGPGKKRQEELIGYDCYPWPYPKADFVSLSTLVLRGSHFPKVTCLPHQIQYLTALTSLNICSFEGLEALPEWLGNLECLQGLGLWGCRNLKQLPSVEAFQRLTNLQSLRIQGCPLLENKCRRESGSEWIKIANIPRLQLLESYS